MFKLLKETFNENHIKIGVQTVDQEVVEMLTNGGTCEWINEANLKSKRPTSFTALIKTSGGVFSLYTSTLEFVGEFEGAVSVNLLVNDRELFRYTNLESAGGQWLHGTKLGSQILLGTPYKDKPFGFEYCTQWQGDSKYPIRINGRTYYRQNPSNILDGTYIPPAPVEVNEVYIDSNYIHEFDDEEADEWLEYEQVLAILGLTEEDLDNEYQDPKDLPESFHAEFDESWDGQDETGEAEFYWNDDIEEFVYVKEESAVY